MPLSIMLRCSLWFFFFFWLENKELLFDCVLWYLISFEFPMEEVILVCNVTATVLLRSELD